MATRNEAGPRVVSASDSRGHEKGRKQSVSMHVNAGAAVPGVGCENESGCLWGLGGGAVRARRRFGCAGGVRWCRCAGRSGGKGRWGRCADRIGGGAWMTRSIEAQRVRRPWGCESATARQEWIEGRGGPKRRGLGAVGEGWTGGRGGGGGGSGSLVALVDGSGRRRRQREDLSVDGVAAAESMRFS